VVLTRFTEEAKGYAAQVQNTVVLIDGAELASLMIEHGIGTSTVGSYAVKRIDSDYFLEE
jgi:restriction system protein